MGCDREAREHHEAKEQYDSLKEAKVSNWWKVILFLHLKLLFSPNFVYKKHNFMTM